MLLLPISLTCVVSLTQLSLLEHGGDFVFPSQCCCCPLVHWSSAFHEQKPKDLFLFCPRAKIPGVPKALCIAMACTTKPLVPQSQPLEMLKDPYSCVTPTLDLPLLLSHSQRAGSWRRSKSNVKLSHYHSDNTDKGSYYSPSDKWSNCT